MLLLMTTLTIMASAPPAGDASFSYVALGDSLGAGMGARRGYVERLYQRLGTERAGVALHNLSSSGATTTDVLRAQLPRVERLRPGLVTLTVGTNDLTDGAPVEQVMRNLGKIVHDLHATGAVVVVTNLPAVALAPAVPEAWRAELDARVRSANRALQAVCDENGARVFDLYALSRAEIPRHPEYFSFDGYHPSDDGYDRWATTMWPLVKDALAGHQDFRGRPRP
ncbi:MAG TPA: SGNH/GDSL hydrolase family protein [Polyangia bacterium]|jgi:lysophospholipase L1-like esterase